jgi:hypothetical protein
LQVESSCRHIWIEDSPVTQATVAPGFAICAPIAAGRPKPMVPRPPELIQRPRLFELVELRRPHLVLADIRGDDASPPVTS